MKLPSIFPLSEFQPLEDKTPKDRCPNCGHWLGVVPHESCEGCGELRKKFLWSKWVHQKKDYRVFDRSLILVLYAWFVSPFLSLWIPDLVPSWFQTIRWTEEMQLLFLAIYIGVPMAVWGLRKIPGAILRALTHDRTKHRKRSGLLGILHDEWNQVMDLVAKRERVADLTKDLESMDAGDADRMAEDLGEETLRAIDRMGVNHQRLFRKAQLHLLANRLAYIREKSKTNLQDPELKDCAERTIDDLRQVLQQMQTHSENMQDLIRIAEAQRHAVESMQTRILRSHLIREASDVDGIPTLPETELPEPDWAVIEELASLEGLEDEYQRLKSENQIEDEFRLME